MRKNIAVFDGVRIAGKEERRQERTGREKCVLEETRVYWKRRETYLRRLWKNNWIEGNDVETVDEWRDEIYDKDKEDTSTN